MKKKIIALLSIVLLVPCIFILTACNNDRLETVSINTEDSYSTSSKEELTGYIENLSDENQNVSGFKMTFNISTNILGKSTITEINAIAKIDDQNNLTMKIEAKYEGETSYMYLKDNNLYMSYEGKNYYIAIEDSQNSYINNFPTIDSVLADLQDIQGLIVEVNADGSKYHISYDSGLEKVDTWLVFELDQLIGIRQKMELKQNDMTMSMDVCVKPYNGSVSLPDLSGYTQIAY